MNDHDEQLRDEELEDDSLMRKVAPPPEYPVASPEQIERTWQAIAAHVEKNKVVAFPTLPAWSRRMLAAAALLVVGFGAAWFAAGRGWLPLAPTPQVADGGDPGGPVSPDRAWLAASDYGDRLEVLLLAVARSGAEDDDMVAPAARRASRDLIDDSRFYRRVAERRNDEALSVLLQRIEIILLALATAPEGQEQDALAALRTAIGESDLIDEIRAVRASVPKSPRFVTTGS